MEPESSLPHKQATATYPYPEPQQSSPCLPIPLLKDPFSTYPPIYTYVLQVASSPQVSPPKPGMYVSRPQYMHSMAIGIKVPEWKALNFIVTLNAFTHNCTVL